MTDRSNAAENAGGSNAETIREELTAVKQARARARAEQHARAGDQHKAAAEHAAAAEHLAEVRRLVMAPPPGVGADGTPPDPLADPALIARALAAPDPAEVLRPVFAAEDERKARAGGHEAPRRALPVPEISSERPARVLSLAGMSGTLLSVGGVLLLAGEGGIAKSPLALHVALAVAARTDYGELHGGLFDGADGPVLVASYEDWPAVSADRLRKLAATWKHADAATAALRRVHVLDLAGRPLFGPTAEDGGKAFYNARPDRLTGWWDLWNEARRIKARLVVIDPALGAYVGEANNAAPVREFLIALTTEAAVVGCGVLCVAHSNKAARTAARSEYDPFDAGNVAGSTHWTDAARGVLTLTYDRTDNAAPGARVLAVSKSNYGPARVAVKVDPVRANHGEIVGFGAAGKWDTWKPAKGSAGKKRGGKATANGASVPADDGDDLDVFK